MIDKSGAATNGFKKGQGTGSINNSSCLVPVKGASFHT